MSTLNNIKKQSKRLNKIWPELRAQFSSEDMPLSKAQELISRTYGYASFHAATQAQENIGLSESNKEFDQQGESDEDRFFFNSQNPVLKYGEFGFMRLAATVDMPKTTAVDPDHHLWREAPVFQMRIETGHFKGLCLGLNIGSVSKYFEDIQRFNRPPNQDQWDDDLENERPFDTPLEKKFPMAVLVMVADDAKRYCDAPLVSELNDEELEVLRLFHDNHWVVGNLLLAGQKLFAWKAGQSHVFEDPNAVVLLRKICTQGYTQWWERSFLRKILKTAYVGLSNKVFQMPKETLQSTSYPLALQCGSPALYLGALNASVQVERDSELQHITDDLARFHVLAYVSSRFMRERDPSVGTLPSFVQLWTRHEGLGDEDLMKATAFPGNVKVKLAIEEESAGSESFEAYSEGGHDFYNESDQSKPSSFLRRITRALKR